MIVVVSKLNFQNLAGHFFLNNQTYRLRTSQEFEDIKKCGAPTNKCFGPLVYLPEFDLKVFIVGVLNILILAYVRVVLW